MWDFILNVCRKVGNLIGFDRPLFFGAIILLSAAVIALVCLILIIVSISKKKKAKKQKAEPVIEIAAPVVEEKAEPVQEEVEAIVETQPVQEEKVEPVVEVEEAVVEEVAPIIEEPVVEEKAEPIVEEIAEPVKEEKVEPVKETVKEKKTAPKKSVAKKVVSEPQKTTKKLNGKWIVEKESDGEFVSKLLASNGEVMLTSEIYTTEEGAKSGIETIVRGVEAGNFKVYQDKNDNYYYKIKTANNRLLCVGETYKSKDGCLKAVESVKRIAKDSPIIEGYKDGLGYAEYTPVKLDLEEVKKGKPGKWRIVKTEDGNYSARLFANNGQLMLATEEVSLVKTAKNAIESVKKYAEQGNFIIDHDKFGRFYYKLRNTQKSVICIGESYETLDSCTSAIESVRRFALNAVLVED